MTSPQTIALLGTGGTIAGQLHQNAERANSSSPLAYHSAKLPIDQLIGDQGRQDLSDWNVYSEQLFQIDSKDMQWSHWEILLKKIADLQKQGEVKAIVITHGTDTLEETAFLLAWAMLHTKQRLLPIVLTASMLPFDHPQSDAQQHIQRAIKWAIALAHKPLPDQVVTVVARDHVWSAWQVQKNHPYHVEAIGARYGQPQAIWQANQWQRLESSAQEKYQEAALKQLAPLPVTASLAAINLFEYWPEQAPWVDIFHSGACVNTQSADRLIEAGLEGFVLECTGNGTWHMDWLPLLQKAQQKKIPWAWVSRCPQGRAQPATDESAAYGGLDWSYLSPSKARIHMMLHVLANSRKRL